MPGGKHTRPRLATPADPVRLSVGSLAGPRYLSGDLLVTASGTVRSVCTRRLQECSLRTDVRIVQADGFVFHFPVETTCDGEGPEWAGIVATAEGAICGVLSHGCFIL